MKARWEAKVSNFSMWFSGLYAGVEFVYVINENTLGVFSENPFAVV